MNCKIAKAIKLESYPVAIYHSTSCPEDALCFKEGVWGCVVAMLNAASKGKTAAFSKSNVMCKGGLSGLGLKPFETGFIEYFLSVGTKEKSGEHYKKTPQLALDYISNLPKYSSDDYVIFKPLNTLNNELPQSVVFLVNADQLSGLVTLANYDKSNQDNVKILFGSGCAQAVLNGIVANSQGNDSCFIGLTDPSARKCIDKNIMSFTIPYNRFLEMESNVESCFFKTKTWQTIYNRI